MKRSKRTGKVVTNSDYVRELGEGFFPSEKDLRELADIARFGLPGGTWADELDSFCLGVLEKHHGLLPPDGCEPEYDDYDDHEREGDGEEEDV